MKYRAWVQINFDAGHAPPWKCGDAERPHGHRYSIRAYVQNAASLADVRTAMDGLRYELQGDVLDTLLPGVTTTPEGLAHWALERLPMVSGVMVQTSGDEAVEVER